MNYELYHHGILGQKWGKKNGPPYPLGSSEHSKSEKKAGWRKSLDKTSNESYTKDDRKGLSDKQKKAIKVGAAVVATALVAYGTYRLVKSGKLDNAIDLGKSKLDEMLGKSKSGSAEIGKQAVDSIINNKRTETVLSNGLKKLSHAETLSETLQNVNPLSGTKEMRNNCTCCSIATFLRQKGYDVTAGSTGGERQDLGAIVTKSFKGVNVIDGSSVKFGRSRKDAEEMLLKRFGQNAEGVVSIKWKGENTGSHAFNWKIKDGVVSFFDGQSGRGDNIVSRYWNHIDVNGDLKLARLDNLEIDTDEIGKYIKSN